MSGNIIILGKKIFEIPPFFQTRPGDLGKKVHACSLRFSALNAIRHLSEFIEKDWKTPYTDEAGKGLIIHGGPHNPYRFFSAFSSRKQTQRNEVEAHVDNFIQITVFCQHKPRVDAFMYRNTEKVYQAG